MHNKPKPDPVENPVEEMTIQGIHLEGEDDGFGQEKTMVMDRPPPPLKDAPQELDSSDAMVYVRVKDRLGAYLGTEAPLENTKPMDEWDLCVQGRLSETDILQAYNTATNLPVVDDEDLTNLDAFPGITYEYLHHALCLPVSWDSDSVVVAVAAPYNLGQIAYQWKQVLGGRKCRFVLAQRSHIERQLTALYDSQEELNDEMNWQVLGDASEEALRDLALEAPIVRLVNDMFAQAVEMGASDIHVEPSEKELTIRFRVDGVLQTVMTPPVNSFPAIASRIKLVGHLNIAERRLPQDGRTELQIGRAKIDVRISTLPSMHGESIVLRILRKDIANFTLPKIGMAERDENSFKGLIRMPHGMILVVGPTGSGKTTTLYCAMGLINTQEKKVITIEDPIEYQIAGVIQIQVKPSIGMTFASGLRHIVRQDPDIILVGEIRDKETAEIAIHAALTGHLVLSTLHTNDATGAISRLLDMGVENFLISSALIGVLSQRLVRKICPDCKGEGVIHLPKALQTNLSSAEKGCRNCNGSGYRGRVGIFEFLRMSDELRNATNRGVDNTELARIARAAGMKTLREDGDAKAASGLTSRAEVARVCQLDAATD